MSIVRHLKGPQNKLHIRKENKISMAQTINDVLRTTTRNYLNTINPASPPSPATIEEDLLSNIATAFDLANSILPKGSKWKIPQKLEFQQLADIVAYLYPVCRVATAGENADSSYDLLAIYQSSGPDEGTYVTSDEIFRSIARSYCYSITSREFNEFMTALRDIVPRVKRCTDKDLIAVNNGIFNYQTKQLMPFTPNKVFLVKSKVNYNPNAQNVVIHNPKDNTDWDVESWMNELADDPEVVNLLWEILGAIIRPHVSWGKCALFYSETGNNGKGTLCELMRRLCGDGSYASIPLSDMGKDFMLEPLTRATAIIVDENDVGTYVDKAANLKAIITNDVIQINRKFKTPIPYQFYGFMVQCLNEMPRIKDKSDSFYRRQLFIPFYKTFTGHERKYIKTDYLQRPEVLEYVLYKVLNMNYEQLSTPETCRIALAEYKEYNDPVRQFAEDILPICNWDLLPFSFLYELYKAWFTRYMPSGTTQSRNTFIKDLLIAIADDETWECKDKNAVIRTGNKISVPEPLIIEYDLKSWMNKRYIGSADVARVCTPTALSESYRGLTRK